MQLNNFKKASALLGVAAIAISASYASFTNSPEQVEKRAIEVQQCVKDFRTNLNDISGMYDLAQKRASVFTAIKKNLGEDTALDMAFDATSHVSDGTEAKAFAKKAEKTLLRNVGNFDIDVDNPNDNSQIIQLCESSKVRDNVKETRQIITEETGPKSRLDKYRPA